MSRSMPQSGRAPVSRPAPARPPISFNASATINNRGIQASAQVAGVPVFGPLKGNGTVTVNKPFGQPAQVSTKVGVGL